MFSKKRNVSERLLDKTKGLPQSEKGLRPPIPLIKPKKLSTYGRVQLQSDPIATIKIIAGPLTNSWIVITEATGRITFGRGPDVDISFEKAGNIDDFVSIKHFAINVGMIEDARAKRKNYKIKIFDLRSDNGTFVNSERVPDNIAIELVNGDEIWIGNSILVFEKL